MDEKFLKTPTSIKLINKIRGGSLVKVAIALIVINIMWQILGLRVRIGGFVLNSQNHEQIVDRPNPFQPPGGHIRHPLVYDLFSPRKTPGCISTLEMTGPYSVPHQEFVVLTTIFITSKLFLKRTLLNLQQESSSSIIEHLIHVLSK